MRSGLLVLGLFAWGALAQQPAQMPPSEELKAATAPFEAARAQPDDLTDADRLALRVGVSRSAQACLALQPSLASLSSQSDELLAFSRLCIFGQQFEPARQGAVQYLTLPATPKREMALLLLVQAFLGLGYGTVLLVPFTLWAPSTLATVRSLPTTAVRQPVYLVTSWSANTGGVDKETPELLAALRDYARALPKHVSIFIVPKALLEQFHADVFPTAIVIRDGMVQANVPLVGEAAERIIGVALGATPSDSPRNASKLR